MREWPHRPAHRLTDAGAYMVTASTYLKEPFFGSAARLTFLCDALLELAEKHEWKLQAWAVFSNHYHFVGACSQPDRLRILIRELHSITAHELNRQDNCPGRKVWFQYWESRLTFSRSYFVRLSYVHQNAVRHGLVRVASAYPWCSAGWFERRAERSLYRRIMEFSATRLNVPDDFDVERGSLGLDG